MIDLYNISKMYLVGDEEVHALDHATMHIDKGEFVSIIGPSGSGKSTVIDAIQIVLYANTDGRSFFNTAASPP